MSKLDPDKVILMRVGNDIKVGDFINIGWDAKHTERVKILKIYEVKFTGESKGTYAAYCDVSKAKESDGNQ